MQLDLNVLPDHPVHVSGFAEQDPSVLELDAVAPAYAFGPWPIYLDA
jgi:hypothetical protein